MRKIILRQKDYDGVVNEDWYIDYPAYLVSPTTVIYSDNEGIYFHYYNEPIGKDAEMVYMYDDAYSRTLHDGKKIPEIAIDDLPNLTIAELAILLKRATL